jgi:hypothetical protein
MIIATVSIPENQAYQQAPFAKVLLIRSVTTKKSFVSSIELFSNFIPLSGWSPAYNDNVRLGFGSSGGLWRAKNPNRIAAKINDTTNPVLTYFKPNF